MTLNDYLRHRRAFEVGLWVLFFAVQATANAWVTIRDASRAEYPLVWWEPFVWQISSVIVLALLIPVLIAFDRRYPLQLHLLHRNLPRHLLFTVPFSMVHILGMVILRHAAYAFTETSYRFGPWSAELIYEYVKDVRTYAALLALIYLYRFVLVRLQGEASLLGKPDDGDPVDPVDRPERILVRKLGKEFLIRVGDVEWIEASGNYVNLHVAQRVYPLRDTMSAIEQRFDPSRFRRVHRSYFVNLDFVKEIEPLETGDARIRMAGGEIVPCSRRYRANLSV